MNDPAPVLLILGSLFLLGVGTDYLGNLARIPRVTFLLLVGLLLGPLGFGVLAPGGEHQWLSVAADIALVMVGFMLGSHFTLDSIREHGALVLWFSIMVVVATVAIMVMGLLLLGAPLEVALLLAGIATATDPAVVMDAVKETKARGLFSETLIGIVAIDDALGLIAFSVLLAVAQSLNGGVAMDHVLLSLWEIGGALAVGAGVGFIMVRLLKFAHREDCPGRREMVLMETLGFVLVCGGAALYLKVSFLLASMMLGAVVVNLIPRDCVDMIQAIESIMWPFLTLFFVFAGASLQPESLPHIGLIGLGYAVFRVLGRVVGGWAGAIGSKSPARMGRWMGMALLPQAGIALGMALIAVQQFPHLADVILPIVIGSTVLFQLVGPFLTRKALVRNGEK